MSNVSKLFKAYDIRGTYPEINERVYFLSAMGLVETTLKPEGLPLEVVLVHDTRLTSPQFFKAFYNGLLAAGAKPIALGIGSTDFMYAATHVTQTPGAMITASHNPKDDNGVKILKRGSEMLGMESGLAAIRDYVIANYESYDVQPETWVEVSLNESKRQEVLSYFVNKIREIGEISQVDQILAESGQKLKIAVDAGNGMGGWVMEQVKDLYSNIEFVPMYWELDGNYPNHPADPQDQENVKEIKEMILKNPDVNFGIAFDGDADRAYFIDDLGQFVQGDFICSFFAKTLLNDLNGGKISGYEPACVYIQPGSRCVPETITQNAGIAVPSKQGHTFVKAKMTKYKAIYGGEYSGHHYFGQFGNMDSGILAAVLIIKILVTGEGKLSEIFAQLNNSYYISELMNLPIPEGKDFAEVKEDLKAAFAEAEFNELDGISVYMPGWKFNLRPSNTEPVMRFMLETRNVDTISEKVAKVKAVIG